MLSFQVGLVGEKILFNLPRNGNVWEKCSQLVIGGSEDKDRSLLSGTVLLGGRDRNHGIGIIVILPCAR